MTSSEISNRRKFILTENMDDFTIPRLIIFGRKIVQLEHYQTSKITFHDLSY